VNARRTGWERTIVRCRPCEVERGRVRRLPIELSRGQLKVARSALFLDAHRRSECAFVSHAHGDHIARHDRTIATFATVALMRHRLGAKERGEALPADYRKPFGLGLGAGYDAGGFAVPGCRAPP